MGLACSYGLAVSCHKIFIWHLSHCNKDMIY